MLLYSFKENILAGGWPTVVDCPNFKYKGRCVNECPNKLNNTNIVNINKECVDSRANGYLQNVSMNNYLVFHPFCDKYLVVH